MLVGFHSLYIEGSGAYAETFSREEMERAISHFRERGGQYSAQIDTAQLSGSPAFVATKPFPYKKSSLDATLRFSSALPDAICFGTTTLLAGATSKTACVDTFFRKHPLVVQLESGLGSYPFFTAPTFGGKMEGDRWVDPHTVSLENSANVPGRRSIWDKCVADYLDGAEELGQNMRARPLSDYDAFFGVPETVIGGTNMASSMGLPFQCKKRDSIRVDYSQDPPTVDFPEGFMRQIQAIESVIKQGDLYSPVCNHVLKDEVISVTKNANHKVRVFNILPFAFNHVLKKYLAPITAFTREHHSFFESAVGMDITCLSEAEELATFLSNPERTLAFDKSSFDAKCSTEEHLAVCLVYRRLAKICGYTAEDCDFVFRLCLSAIYPLRAIKGDLFMISYSMPSGFWMTIHFNCVRSSLQSRYAWYALVKQPPPFRAYVRQLTLGDDIIATVSSQASWFNQKQIQRALKEIGAVVTSCRKETELVDFENLEDVQFLKRTLRYVEGFPVWALEEKTLIKMLCMRRKSSELSDVDAHSIILSNILSEAWMWGRERFDVWWKIVMALAEKYHLRKNPNFRPSTFDESLGSYTIGKRRQWHHSLEVDVPSPDLQSP